MSNDPAIRVEVDPASTTNTQTPNPATAPTPVTPPVPPAAPEQTQNTQRPDWLLPKYKNIEDQAKAYVHLEKLLGQRNGTKQEPQATPEAPAQEGQEKGTQEGTTTDSLAISSRAEAAEALTNKGLSMEKYEQEFMQSGNISKESRQELEKAGIPGPMVDQYIKGIQATQRELIGDLFKQSGLNETQFKKIGEWASKNLPADQLESYNKMANSGDIHQMAAGLDRLKNLYNKANGDESQKPILGNQRTSSSEEPYTRYQMVEDMKSDRYKKDPAFQAEVARKIHRWL